MSTSHVGHVVSSLDPRDERFAAVSRAGNLAFVAGVEGRYAPGTGELDRGSFGDGVRQSRNAYEEVVRRLRDAGLGPRNLVRVEHLTSSQEFRLARMALWPEIFGTPTRAVSQGEQAKMRGQNMASVCAVAYADENDIEAIVPGPSDGRASRITRAGNWYFVIGVRGHSALDTGEEVEDDIPDAIERQAKIAYRNIEHHLAAAGLNRENLVRFDCFIRDISVAMRHRDVRTAHFDGRMWVSSTVVGVPLGGTSDIELSAMAYGDLSEREVVYYEGRVDLARTVRAGDIILSSGALGNRGVDGKLMPSSYGDPTAQLHNALDRSEASLADFGASLADVARLDVYLTDQYWEPQARDVLAERFPGIVPACNFVGCELEPSALVEVTALAYRPQGSR